MRVTTGTYTGDGAASRTISGLLFSPLVVFLFKDGDIRHWKSTTMPSPGSKKLWGDLGLITDVLASFTGDGFTVGASGNLSATTYHWIALNNDPLVIKVGTYVGDGLDNRNITGVGFQPDYVLLQPREVAGVATPIIEASCRPSTLAGDATFTVDGGVVVDRIQALSADGFQVGAAFNVNKSGINYDYVALKKTPGNVDMATYTGNGLDNRDIVQADPFRPSWVWIHQSWWTHKTETLTGDAAFLVAGAGILPNNIQALSANGFQAGTEQNTSGLIYHYASLVDLPPPMPPLQMARERYRGLVPSVFSY